MDEMKNTFNKKIEGLEKQHDLMNGVFEGLLPNVKNPKMRQQMLDVYRLLTMNSEEIQQRIEAN